MAGTHLPQTVQTPRAMFRFDASEPGPDGQALVRGSIQSFGGWAQFACSMADLVAFADMIYRTAGRQPREVEQVVRVEFVAAAPPAPIERYAAKAEDPHEGDVDEVAQIRKRMLDGR